MDSRKERAIIVEYKNQIINFQESSDGLYYHDTHNKFISHVNYYSCLSNVKDNKEYFSTSEIKGGDKSRKLQQEIGWPITSHLKEIFLKQIYTTVKSQWTILADPNSSTAHQPIYYKDK